MEKLHAQLLQGDGLLTLPDRWLPGGCKQVLLIHSPSISGAHLQPVIDALQEKAVLVILPFRSNLLEWKHVHDKVQHFSRNAFDTIIALGGGTVIDLAKCLKYHLQSQPRLIAIPSTVGTGSEATCFATYFESGRKQSLHSEHLLPDQVVLDPSLCMTLPESVLQSTCLDAFCQAVESYWSIHSTPESRKHSMEALSLILPAAETGITKNGYERLAKLQFAAFLSGKAINIAKTTLSHAFSYRLTSHHGIPHGYAVAATLPMVALYNMAITQKDCQDPRGVLFVQRRLRALNKALGEGANLSMTLERWVKKIGGPGTLQQPALKVGTDLESIVDEALTSGRAGNNPRALHRQELMKLFRHSKI